MTLSQIFEQILEKPELYTGRSVTKLASFIEGYKMTLYDLSKPASFA